MATELPFIDEFETIVDAPPSLVFPSVARRMGRTFDGLVGRAFTALLGCAHRGSNYTVPPVEDQEVNGFRVAQVDAPGRLVLEGRHRFAAYRLSLFIDEVETGRSRVRARTDAIFPGIKGAAYRALVITSGAHRFIVKRMLQTLGRGSSETAVGAQSSGS